VNECLGMSCVDERSYGCAAVVWKYWEVGVLLFVSQLCSLSWWRIGALFVVEVALRVESLGKSYLISVTI